MIKSNCMEWFYLTIGAIVALLSSYREWRIRKEFREIEIMIKKFNPKSKALSYVRLLRRRIL